MCATITLCLDSVRRLAQRILVLDGAMGTMIQGAGLAADDSGARTTRVQRDT
jgi:methionine synthase I (cobalamin-dependent)